MTSIAESNTGACAAPPAIAAASTTKDADATITDPRKYARRLPRRSV